jgi:hypothetical protein
VHAHVSSIFSLHRFMRCNRLLFAGVFFMLFMWSL